MKVQELRELFPHKSWEDLEPHIMSILRLQNNTGKPSGVTTRRTRRLHFFMFLRNMGLDDDHFMQSWSHQRRIWTLAMYSSHLCTGQTIRGKPIRADSIRGYLQDIAKFIYCRIGVDPRYEKGETHLADPIQRVLTEYERWEKEPNRRQPWTVAMQQHLDKVVTNATFEYGDDAFKPAVADWTAFGLSAGIRRSEWVQPDANHSSIDNPELKDGMDIISAFLPGDWVFSDKSNKKLTHDQALFVGIDNIARLRVTWRTQKNGTNYETKLYLRNMKHPDLCPVVRAFSILERYSRVIGFDQPDVPLAVYKNGNGDSNRRLLYSEQVTKVIRDSAIAVMKLDPKKDKVELGRYSSHSLRVGACQILYANGFSAYEIKHLLHWKSDAFMVYLRDIAWVARKQTEAMSTVADAVEPFL